MKNNEFDSQPCPFCGYELVFRPHANSADRTIFPKDHAENCFLAMLLREDNCIVSSKLDDLGKAWDNRYKGKSKGYFAEDIKRLATGRA